MKDILLLLLLSIGNHFELKIVGTLSISDIAIVFLLIYQLTKHRYLNNILHDKDIIYITKLYIVLLGVQFITELLVNNEIQNTARGLAITVFSYIKFLFYWKLVITNKKNVLWLFVTMCLAEFIFMNKAEGIEDISTSSIISGESYSFFKFKIAPLIAQTLVVIALIYRRYNFTFLFLVTGGICIILGARSTGLMVFLTGVVANFIQYHKHIKSKTIVIWGIISSIFIYGLFVVYVNAVLSGAIVGGNSSIQFSTAKNPYNPLYILLSGRTESPASLAAISDSPFIGWGAWAIDPNFKYHRVQAAFRGEVVENQYADIIPAHSVILQTGVNNGLFAMLVVILIILFFIKKGGVSLKRNNPYFYLVLFCIMQLLWNGLFSPVNHFRSSFPIYFVCCLYSYKYIKSVTIFKHRKHV